MIVRTDAVVLRAFDYGETSKIATLFTRRSGLVSVLARGVRRPKSRFGATLQPLSYIQVVYYEKDTRSLQTLKESSYVQRFPKLLSNVDRLASGYRIVELVRALSHEGNAQPSVLRLIVEAFSNLNESEQWHNTTLWFQLHLASLLGFSPAFSKDELNAIEHDDEGVLSLETGAVVKRDKAKGKCMPAPRAALRAFAVLSRTDLATSSRMNLTNELRSIVEQLVDAYISYHSEKAPPDKVQQVIKQLEDKGKQLSSSSNLPEPNTETLG